jgi:hypothetical protein
MIRIRMPASRARMAGRWLITNLIEVSLGSGGKRSKAESVPAEQQRSR